MKKFDWVRNLFLTRDTSLFDLTLNEEEGLILLSIIVIQFYILIHFRLTLDSMIAKKALNISLQFSPSYLCELGFSALTNIETNKDQDF